MKYDYCLVNGILERREMTIHDNTWVFVGEISTAGWNRKMFVVEHSYLPCARVCL